MKHGMTYLSEDRKGKGLLLRRDLTSNLTLAALRRFCRGFLVEAGREARGLEDAVRRFDIRLRSPRVLAGQLSGGNQQKLLLAKMLLGEPRVIVVDEPTRGIDVGTKAEVHRLIDELAGEGLAVLMISSELPEVLGMSDRVLVMREGRLTAELSRAEAIAETVMTAATRSAVPA